MNSYNLENEERKNRTNAFILTFIINAAMLFLFWKITVWSAEENQKKDEILAGGGFIMNYGTDKAGSGNVYSRNKANKSPEVVDSKPSEEIKKTKEVTVPEPEVNKNKLTPTKKEVEQPLIASTKPSSVKYKEVKEVKVDKKEKTKPLTETKKVANKPAAQPVIDNSALFPVKKDNGSNGSSGTNSKAGGASDGNSKGTGNQGQPEGRSVSDAEYTKRPPGDGSGGNGGSGAGNGSSHTLIGWTWNSKPVVDDDSNDTGVIRFKIKIDSDGDVVDISVIESTVSPNVMRKYKSALQRTKFRPTTGDKKTDYSSGTVTFRLNSR